MHRGSCLCGGVRFEVRGELGRITLCHCAQCRKAQGGAFVAASPVKAAEFFITRGTELLSAFESSPGKERVFCRRCGTPLFSRRAIDPETVRIRLGMLDTPVGQPDAHIFVADKADWDELHDDLPQYPGFEPTRVHGKSR